MFSCALIQAGAHPSPGGEMTMRREMVHHQTELRQKNLGELSADTKDPVEQRNQFLKRAQVFLNLPAHAFYRIIEKIDLGEQPRKKESVMWRDFPFQRLQQQVMLASQCPLCEIGQDSRILFPFDDGV